MRRTAASTSPESQMVSVLSTTWKFESARASQVARINGRVASRLRSLVASWVLLGAAVINSDTANDCVLAGLDGPPGVGYVEGAGPRVSEWVQSTMRGARSATSFLRRLGLASALIPGSPCDPVLLAPPLETERFGSGLRPSTRLIDRRAAARRA